MPKILPLSLHIMSPVHIGCGEEYEPLSFKIDEANNKLIEFDPISFINSLNEKEKNEFLRLYSQPSLSAVIKLINLISKKSVIGKEVEISSSVIGKYNRIKSLNPNLLEKALAKSFAKFEIKKTAYNPFNNNPYVPGSSIKGSLRTGYLNSKAKEKHKKRSYESKEAKELEKELLNYKKIEDDPFHSIKVSDFQPESSAKTKIIFAINRKKEPMQSARGISTILEVIKENCSFTGSITADTTLKEFGKNFIDPLALLKAANDFYYSLLEKETKILAKIKASTRIKKEIDTHFGNKLGKEAFCIRIGMHSGAEAVTIENYRKIKVRQKNKQLKELSEATTIWLASEEDKPQTNFYLVPFGWAIIELKDN